MNLETPGLPYDDVHLFMVDTIVEEDIKPSRPSRRSYSLALKTQILQECSKPGVSIAGVALSHGINPNIVHKWRMNGKRSGNTC